VFDENSDFNILKYEQKDIDRFWSKVIIKYNSSCLPLLNECMMWNGGVFSDGYGFFWFRYKMIRAHRFAYQCFNGEIGKYLLVRHTCDVPLCVNPNHLLEGTVQDNCNDMISRNRSLRGEKNHESKLTSDDVRIIKKLLSKNVKQKEIAKKFDVSRGLITQINNNKIWKHI
jgi:predicted XRE-type DNA-binding protein